MTPKQEMVLEAIENYERENGRYPRLKDLVIYLEQNQIPVGTNRRNVIQFIEKMERDGRVKRYEEKDIRIKKTVHKVIRIKSLR